MRYSNPIEEENWICMNCGYSSSKKFIGDICPNCGLTDWRCSRCGFVITAAALPDVCPECGEECDFTNITCYIPGWGGSEYYEVLT